MGAAASYDTGVIADLSGAAPPDSETVGSRLDDAGEMLHTLQTLVQSLAAEIEDQFADAELAIAGDILDHLRGGTGEWSSRKAASAAMPNMDDVAILDQVVFALQAQRALGPGLGFRARLQECIPADDLGSDEVLLQIGMDGAGSLHSS